MKVKTELTKLFESWSKQKAKKIISLPDSGSYRKYFRICSNEKTAIGVFNPDEKENLAFITFTKHFCKKGLNIPEFYAQNKKEKIYLIKDLGDITLYSLVQKNVQTSSTETVEYYKQALQHLIRFQIEGNKGLDYSVCYPRKKFDRQSILWDLNYFKYYFLKLTKTPFDEQKLEGDFDTFVEQLLSTDTKYFMYRDFQSRNILINNNELNFIDYQGGRKGALQYDVASLLFQAKVNLSSETREELLEFYLDELSKKKKIKNKSFKKYFYDYVLIRILQTLGAYGFRGYYENKSHFLQSIPYALKNLQWLIDNRLVPRKIPELLKAVEYILQGEELKKIKFDVDPKKLKVMINSFSYRNGIPKDYTGHGGGFVFDCRSIINPGRNSEYADLSGKDEQVIRFLETQIEAVNFLNSVFSIVNKAVENYLQRNFKNLTVSFGCTGGQHRSVYCAEKLASHLKGRFDVDIELNHIQLDKKDLA